MKYKCENELNTISVHDAQIDSVEKIVDESGENLLSLDFNVIGAIVKDGNSQNEFFADKYTNYMNIRFVNPVIEAMLIEGHKYYDANEKLVDQVPDTPISVEEYDKTLKMFKDNYIFYGGQPKDKGVSAKECYQMIVDVEEESYIISILYDKVIISWEHFQNKANIM